MTVSRKRDHLKFLQNMADYHNARKTSRGYRQFHVEEWDKYTKHWDLSEEFIERFQDKVNWDNVSRYQVLSPEFIKKFKNKLNMSIVLQTQDIPEKLLKRITSEE